MLYTFENSGIREEVSFTDEEINGIFLPLLRRLTALQAAKGRRIIVFLAAPPGAGKSTLVDFLQHLSRSTEGLTPIASIGMDGFHRYQDDLLAHTAIRDGVEIPLVKIKGAPITFDTGLLRDRLQRAASGEACGWPVYNRLLHNPVDNALTVSGSIVLLEGNYLLLNRPGWQELQKYADYTISIQADEALLRERLVRRKCATGVEPAAAEAFVDYSDMANVRTCLAESASAELELFREQDRFRLLRGTL